MADAPRALRDRPAVAYLAAVGLAAGATLIRLALRPWLGPAELPFLGYFPALFIGALLLGARPTILMTLLSALAANYFFFHPTGAFVFKGPVPVIGLVLFISVGIA
nr:DUF4118 domain-containing protein [Gemmatimonadales bacterium]